MSSRERKQKIWNYIKKIKVGMLVTCDADDLRARPMHLVQDEYDGTIWFFTRRSAAKVFEANKENHVCITFSDPQDNIFVTLSGRAKLTQDITLIDRFWSPFVAAWFDEGRDDPDVALLEIKIYQGEHWEIEDSTAFQIYEFAKANLTHDMPEIGENEKFG